MSLEEIKARFQEVSDTKEAYLPSLMNCTLDCPQYP